MAFGRVLKEVRERKNLSQEELAFRSGISRTYPSLLERAEQACLITNSLRGQHTLQAEVVVVTPAAPAPAELMT